MTVDGLLRLAAVTNPGFFIIAAGILIFFARGKASRGLFLIGGPAAALLALMYSPGAGVSHAVVNFAGLELVLYHPDSLSMVFGLAFIFASAIAGVYSLHREDPLQDSTAMIYAGAAVGAVFCGDLLTTFIFWELTAIASVFQVLARKTAEGRASAVRYLIFQLVSGVLLLAGTAMHLAGTGEIAFSQMAERGASPPVGVMDINAPGAWLILIAFGIKAGFPMVHNWIQDFYPKATETGAVVLSAFTTKLAVYALARYFAGLDMLIWIGAIMTVFPVFFAVIENDLRKVLSYSLNNQVGFMVCAVGMGTELAINGAAAHAFAHIMYKSLLFMSMGAVLYRVGTVKASELGGLHRTMPFTTIFCLIGAASIAAVPFFAGFSAKSMIMSSAHGGYGLYVIWLMLLFASAGVMEHSGIKIPFFAFFSHDSGKRPKEAPFNMLLAMGLAAALCMAIGLSPRWLYELLPFRDRAMEYLAQDLFTPEHILEQMQLLAFATLAFMVLKRFQLYPAERPGEIIDIEWTWRKAAPGIYRKVSRPVAGLVASVTSAAGGAAAMAGVVLRQAFAPTGWASRRVLLTAGAAWTLGVLGAVTLIALFVRG